MLVFLFTSGSQAGKPIRFADLEMTLSLLRAQDLFFFFLNTVVQLVTTLSLFNSQWLIDIRLLRSGCCILIAEYRRFWIQSLEVD